MTHKFIQQLVMLLAFLAVVSFSSCKKDCGQQGPCMPSPPCPDCAGAVTAVTWDGTTYFNPGNGYSGFTGYPWTAYKSTPAESCTGGTNTGRIYKWNSSTCTWDFYGIGDCGDSDVYFADGTPNTNACCKK